MGSADPRAFARSKRGIAGSMIMTTFDRHCLTEFMQTADFAAKMGSVETNPSTNPFHKEAKKTGFRPTNTALQAASGTTTAGGVGQSPDLAGIGKSAHKGLGELAPSMSEKTQPMFTDQILPFDSTLMGANEYGIASTMRIYSLEILNEGSGVSIDDTSNEVQMTYIARLISPWINQVRLQDTSGA